MNLNIDFKKFFILLLALIVLFTPTYIAIANYHATKENPQNVDATMLTIKDPDGRVTTATSENDTQNLIPLFKSINAGGSSVASLPENISGTAFLLATFVTGDEEISYKYYFSTDSSSCYYTDGSGNNFRISSSSAKAFLGTGLSIYLYRNATPPTMTVADNVEIKPAVLKWNYLVTGNTFQEHVEENKDPVVLTDVGNVLAPSFDIEPSACTLKVYAGNSTTPVWDGRYDQLSALNPARNTTYRFEVSAQWAQEAGSQYYGTASYSYSVFVSAPAVFKLSRSAIYQGEFAVISVLNVSDPSAITITCDHKLNYTPVFYADTTDGNESAHALIPISYGLEKGTYVFTVSYGVSSENLSLLVEDYRYGYKSGTSAVSKERVDTLYTDSDIKEYNDLLKSICSSSENVKYFSDKFLNYETAGVLTAKGAAIKAGFGRFITLKNSSGKTYEHSGIDFAVSAGVEIPAMNSGKVVFAGSCDILGNFVVIDHGFGLKTWYAHLSELSVSVGDIVTKAQSVGKSGDTGLTEPGRVHVGVTVYDIPVAPYDIWANGVVFANFE